MGFGLLAVGYFVGRQVQTGQSVRQWLAEEKDRTQPEAPAGEELKREPEASDAAKSPGA
jgi:hypothetical protein